MRKVLIWFFALFSSFTQLIAVNHWIVTQSGKVQAYLGSPFDLRRPYDLLALLDQETRRNDVNELYDDLINRKNIIEKKWDGMEKNSNVGLEITSNDVDCVAAEKLFSDIDLYSNIASNGSERGIDIEIPKKTTFDKESATPICSNFTVLKRPSPVVNNTNIILQPDDSLRKAFVPVKSLDHFGNYISSALKRNSTSWVHYNLASFYWRIKGQGDKAIDCLKLAIQFVTENYQDIPLYNIAGILHQARHSKEAAQILHSAIEIAPKEPMHYIAIANIYAAMRDYNKSVMFYEKLLELNPRHKEATMNRHAVLCYYKLETALRSFQSDLQSILTDLHDYHSLQQQWLRLQERLMWEHSSFDYHDSLDPEIFNIDNPKKVQKCIKKTSESSGKPVISCDFYEEGPGLSSLNLENLYQIVENTKHKIGDHLQVSSSLINQNFEFENDNQKDSERSHEILYQKFPTSMPTKENQYFDLTGWPKKEQCLAWDLPVNEKDDLDLPLFLPPENKGHQLKKALSDHINLPEGSQHKLPWYPPICEGENINGEKFVPLNERTVLDGELKATEYLKKEFLKYVNEGNSDEAEIGQRIITAMEGNAAPKWVLATLASLYWRVRGNPRKALDCLDMAFQMVPKDQTDIVLVSLGSTVYQLGFKEQAMKYATLAFKINYIEPSTNFLLALLHYENSNPLLATYYMKNVLRVDSDFYDGLADKLLKTWGCRIKLGTGLKALSSPNVKQPMCSNPEPVKEEGVICSKGENHCKMTTFQCYKRENPVEAEHKGHNICGGNIETPNFGQQIIASLLAAESSLDLEPDQFGLEARSAHDGFYYPQVHHRVHMRLSLGDEHPYREHTGLGDFFVSVAFSDDPDSENNLHVYDKFGTYTLSSTVCRNEKLLETFKYSSVWPSIVARTLDISSVISSSLIDSPSKDLNPYCMQVPNPNMPHNLNELTLKVLAQKLPNIPEKDLTELLALMCGNQKLTIEELGINIANALRQDETSWTLLTASGIYWMVVGNTEQALVCFRGALTKVPTESLDIPLIYLSHLLNRLGLHQDALDVGNIALNTNPHFVLNHYTIANVYITAGGYKNAVPYLRASLQLDSNFEPARSRLKAVLCKVLFDETRNTAATITAKLVDPLA